MSADPDMAVASQSWPRTNGGRKLVCPECGLTGYPDGTWLNNHREHRRCSCGRVVTTKGYRTHRVSMQRHGRPCPPER